MVVIGGNAVIRIKIALNVHLKLDVRVYEKESYYDRCPIITNYLQFDVQQ